MKSNLLDEKMKSNNMQQSLVHTTCECECHLNFNVTLIFAAKVLHEFSTSKLMQIICCDYVMSTFVSHLH